MTASSRLRLRLRRSGLRLVAVASVALTIGAVAISVLVDSGCADSAPSSAAPAPIRIGVSLGLTNNLAAPAAPLRDSIRVAEGQINAAGGLLGRPVEFHIEDDRSDEGPFVTGVAQRFVDEGVVAVI